MVVSSPPDKARRMEAYQSRKVKVHLIRPEPHLETNDSSIPLMTLSIM